ncbi:uncharacterized protein METZ01_LOCUS188691, partial [marine metagenome]
MNISIQNPETQPVQLIELEIKYLRQTINVLRDELEKSKINEEEKVQAVKKTYNDEINQLKETVNNLRNNLEQARIGEEERVQQAVSKVND